MNVQLEHGYTKIANEIVDALCKYYPGFTEGQVLWAIIRKTYGWNKKADKISVSQLVKATGKSRRMVIYAVQNLEAKKMITVTRDFRETNSISFNKDYSEWLHDAKTEQYKKLHLVQKVAPSATSRQKLVQHSVKNIPKVAPTKETNTKDTTKESVPAENYFSSLLNEQSAVVISKAAEFDVRPKDIAYCARMAMEWYRGNKTAPQEHIWWDSKFNQWIARSIRRHEVATLSAKAAEEAAKQTSISAEDKWILEKLTIVGEGRPCVN